MKRTACPRIALMLILAVAQLVVSMASRAEDEPVLVFAAASLKNALDDVAGRYQSATGRAVVVSYAASSTLAKQILAGAPAQIFISADQGWMDLLEKNDAIVPATRQPLLGNELVLVAPKDAVADISLRPGVDLMPQLGDGRLAVAETSAVPAGKYARAALEHLGIWSTLENRLAQAPDVRAALALVARGEAPLGIVYASDAAAEPDVRVLATFPPDTHAPIVYPAALTREAKDERAAAFLDYLSSREAAAIFGRHGFKTLTCANDCNKTN